MRRELYRVDPDGEPDYDGYEEVDTDEEYGRGWEQDTYLW